MQKGPPRRAFGAVGVAFTGCPALRAARRCLRRARATKKKRGNGAEFNHRNKALAMAVGDVEGSRRTLGEAALTKAPKTRRENPLH